MIMEGSRMADSKRICSVDGCGNKHFGKGLCCKHHRRMLRHGSLKNPHRASAGDPQKWIHENKNHEGDGCLKWPFSTSTNGYGNVIFEDSAMVASRAMCIAAHGVPPKNNMDAAHVCGKGHEGCVNPHHLRWATRSENLMDRDGHGTMLRGASIRNSKLNTIDVIAIRLMAKSKTHKFVADQFGVTRSHVGSIVTRRVWGHLPKSPHG